MLRKLGIVVRSRQACAGGSAVGPAATTAGGGGRRPKNAGMSEILGKIAGNAQKA